MAELIIDASYGPACYNSCYWAEPIVKAAYAYPAYQTFFTTYVSTCGVDKT